MTDNRQPRGPLMADPTHPTTEEMAALRRLVVSLVEAQLTGGYPLDLLPLDAPSLLCVAFGLLQALAGAVQAGGWPLAAVLADLRQETTPPRPRPDWRKHSPRAAPKAGTDR